MPPVTRGRACVWASLAAWSFTLVRCEGNDFNFRDSIMMNNLGGSGPDVDEEARVMRFRGVTSSGGKPVDMTIRAREGYSPADSKANKLTGDFVQINLRETVVGKFYVEFTDPETNDTVYLKHSYHITFYDLDGTKNNFEWVRAHGFTHYKLSDQSEVKYEETWFKATQRGKGSDNPESAKSLTVLQKRRSVVFTFPPGKGFSFDFEVAGDVDEKRGRNILLSGVDAMSEEEPTPKLEDTVTMPSSRMCKGDEKEWGACPKLPACNACKPINCKFGAWGDWFSGGGCTGVCFRHRNIEHPNNKCGGKPCKGAKIESKKCPGESCKHSPIDCKFSEWTEWSDCDDNDQKTRGRHVQVPVAFDGEPCSGAYKETASCNTKAPMQDCTFSDWGTWSQCSASCGGGWHVSKRRVMKHAAFGGDACAGSTKRIARCKTQPCASKDCQLGPWNAWSGCDVANPSQKTRTRGIKSAGDGADATACAGVMKEAAGCPSASPVVKCQLGRWSSWSECDKTCGGGQSYRGRVVNQEPENGGACPSKPMRETRACAEQPCNVKSDCLLSEWNDWTACSTNCGIGESYRERKVISEAKSSGEHCNGYLKEVKGCRANGCADQDCVWGDWDAWSACSCSCGGGMKRRSRVVKVSPTGLGKTCSAEDKSEVMPCKTQRCDGSTCIDGRWMKWSKWSACSATCGSGFKVRHRDVDQEPNSCGTPVTGLEDDYQKCDAGAPCVKDLNCMLSDWTDWSKCSCNCVVRERHRWIKQFASGKGRSCKDAVLKEFSQCDPKAQTQMCGSVPVKDCEIGMWSDWGECSQSCNGGRKTRSREIDTPSDLEGSPCNGALQEVAKCNTRQCVPKKCMDCVWDHWTDWTTCSRCGGQRYRHRSIVQMPDECGLGCDPKDAKETSSCTSPCTAKMYCAWTSWSDYGDCSATCGSGSKMRQRQLRTLSSKPKDFLFEGTETSTCGGAQLDFARCSLKSCPGIRDQVDCQFSDWGEWTPTCVQLCERTRRVERMNAWGGRPCHGALVETKHCAHSCSKVINCQFSAWGNWSKCAGDSSQRVRSRTIVNKEENGGAPCIGLLKETLPCEREKGGPEVLNCKVSDWSDWRHCSKTCGTGVQKRVRQVAQKATEGGKPCTASLTELQTCGEASCSNESKVDCSMSDWSEWSSCDGGKRRQQLSTRHVVEMPTGGGRACEGDLKRTKPCTVKVDCKVSDWSDWEVCDKNCDGQQVRSRFMTEAPLGGGSSCPEILEETRGCNPGPCGKVDCELGRWTDWSDCSVTCRFAGSRPVAGHQSRSRKVVRMPAEGGAGCNQGLAEIRACPDLPECEETIDCVWSEWHEWSGCSCECHGGQRSRDRTIKQAPRPGGKLCDPKAKEEIEPCNTQKCKQHGCVDGAWEDWADWETCSSTCAGGITWRTRLLARKADKCGRQAVGPDREVRSCNLHIPCDEDIDCKFSKWGEWSDCTKDCFGVKHRGRSIVVAGRGHGAWCKGALSQSSPCNPAPDEDMPNTCQVNRDVPPTNCVMGKWGRWSECSQTCGHGQQTRERSIVQNPSHGGKGCQDDLQETRGCDQGPCSTCEPVNCAWADWSEWSACDTCGGQKRRVRHQKTPASCGGAPCKVGYSEEVTNCTRQCHEATYCGWSLWSSWGSCTATCGSGSRFRTRSLTVTTPDEVSFIETDDVNLLRSRYEALLESTTSMTSQHHQELMLAFASGLISLSAVTAVVRRFRSRQAPDDANHLLLQQVGAEGC